jgi:mannosyltransferase OCH1-like enzyme
MGKIPQITHQIWLQGWDMLPEKFQENVRLLNEKNPDYRHMKWDESSLYAECAKIGPEVANRFDSFPHLIQKVDLGRMVVLYNYGGISVDTDMKPLRPIDFTPHLDSAECMISKGAFPLNMIGHTNNAVILCRPRHPFVEDVVRTMVSSSAKESNYPTKELYINATTGPRMFEEVIARHREKIVFLDNKFYEPCFSVDPMCSASGDSIMLHEHEMSWVSPFFRDLFRLLFPLIYVLIVAVPLAALYYLTSRSKGVPRGSRSRVPGRL